MADQEIPELEQIKEHIATVQKRANIRVKDYLGFGALHTPLKTKTNADYHYHGEINENGYEHGRGIEIWYDDQITIGYFDDDDYKGTGNYIQISVDGVFRVGERYMKDGDKWVRGTQYNLDGTEEQYDE